MIERIIQYDALVEPSSIPSSVGPPSVAVWLPRFPDGNRESRVNSAVAVAAFAAVFALPQLQIPGPTAWKATHPDQPAPAARVVHADAQTIAWNPNTPVVAGAPTIDGWEPIYPSEPVTLMVSRATSAYVETLEQYAIPGPLAWRSSFPDRGAPPARSLALDQSYAHVLALAQFTIQGPLAWKATYPDRGAPPVRVPVAQDQSRGYLEALEQYAAPSISGWKSVHPDRGVAPARVPPALDLAFAAPQALVQFAIPGPTAWTPRYPDQAAARARVPFALDQAFAWNVFTPGTIVVPPIDGWSPHFPDRAAATFQAALQPGGAYVPALAQFAAPSISGWLARYPDQPAPPMRRGIVEPFTWYSFTPGTVVVQLIDKWLAHYPDQPIPWKRPWPQNLAVVRGLEQLPLPAPLVWGPLYPDRPAAVFRSSPSAPAFIAIVTVPAPPLSWRGEYPTHHLRAQYPQQFNENADFTAAWAVEWVYGSIVRIVGAKMTGPSITGAKFGSKPPGA